MEACWRRSISIHSPSIRRCHGNRAGRTTTNSAAPLSAAGAVAAGIVAPAAVAALAAVVVAGPGIDAGFVAQRVAGVASDRAAAGRAEGSAVDVARTLVSARSAVIWVAAQ